MVAVTTMAAVLPVALSAGRLAVIPVVIGGTFGRLVVSVDRLGCRGVGGVHRSS
jgi:hypothetical protein